MPIPQYFASILLTRFRAGCARRLRPPSRGQPNRFLAVLLLTLAAVATVSIIATGHVDGAGRTVRVGIYQNKPKIFVDEKGRPTGLFINLLEEIAAEEGWTLYFVRCEWAECLDALEEGRIDLLPDMAYSLERDEQYDFHRTPVTESWSQVYAHPRTQMNGFSGFGDLAGKRVAVLDGSIQQTVFEQYMRGFGFDVTIVPTGSLEETFEMTENGSADAAIANHFFGDFYYAAYGLIKTSIILNPATLYYATAQGRNADLLDAIDLRLDTWIQETNSPYFTTLARWIKTPPVYRVPRYVPWAIGAVGGLLIGAFGAIWLLRSQVQARTKKLDQAHEALRQSEERYRIISTVAADYMFSTRLDADGERVLNWVAGAFEAITGYEFQEYIAHGGWRATVHPDDLAIDDRDMEKLGANQPAITEIRTLNKNGETVWVRVYAQPVWDAERGKLVGIHGAVQDITKRKQAEAALHESEERYRSLVENAPDAIYVHFEDRVILVNQACSHLFRASSKGELLGKSIYDLFHPDSHSIVRERIHHLRSLGKPVPAVEEKIICLDGHIVDVETSAAPFPFSGGTAIHVIMRDITERKQVEAQLAEQLDELRRWHQAILGRETRTVDLKHEVNELLRRLGEQPRYPSAEMESPLEDHQNNP